VAVPKTLPISDSTTETIVDVGNEDKKEKATSKAKPTDDGLFGVLRKVRREIAAQQQVTAFIVFSDSTLIDMCQKMPVNNYEMLQVNGVGQVKMDRYGEIFLKAIRGYISGD
jgi:ATP-dependent DNA helicase RecQ